VHPENMQYQTEKRYIYLMITLSTQQAKSPETGINKCTICGATSGELIHLSLYMIGSEGVEACLSCRISLTEVAQTIFKAAGQGRKQGYLACKRAHS